MDTTKESPVECRGDKRAMQAALKLLESLATNHTPEEIQSLASAGKLEALLPDAFDVEPISALPPLSEMTAAPTRKLSKEAFREFLQNT